MISSFHVPVVGIVAAILVPEYLPSAYMRSMNGKV
jgi:hypothetical protein